MEASSEPLVEIRSPIQTPRVSSFTSLLRPTIEPCIFLMFFALSFGSVVNQNQIIKLTCTTIFGYDEAVCEKLEREPTGEEMKHINKIVQPYAAKILTASSVTGTLISALVGLFYGSWSDKYGRRPLLLISVTGFFFSSVLTTLFTYLSTRMTINPWIYVSCCIPAGLVGGVCSLLGGSHCYIADISTVKEQPIRLVVFGIYLSAGLFSGSLLSGFAFEAWNATVVFGIATVIHLLAIFYTSIFVKESLNCDNLESTSKFRGLFQWNLVKELVKTLIEARPYYNRGIIWLCIGVLSAGVFAMEGASNVFFLFVRDRFSWTTKDYTTYNGISMIAGSLGSTVVVIVSQKVLGVSMVLITLVGLGSHVIGNVIFTVATEAWHLYLAVGISVAKNAAFPMLRSIISNIVPENDIGKIYSLCSALEFVTPLGAAPLYLSVYTATLDVNSGLFNGLSAGIFCVCYLLVTILFAMEVRNPYLLRKSKQDTLSAQ